MDPESSSDGSELSDQSDDEESKGEEIDVSDLYNASSGAYECSICCTEFEDDPNPVEL